MTDRAQTDAHTGEDQDDITIDRWMTGEMKRLADFVAFWRNGSVGGNPTTPADAFPPYMPAGEWDEQYRTWGGA